MYPKVAGFASLLVPSIIDAISSSAKMQNPYTMHSFVTHPAQKTPTRFHEDPEKFTLCI